MTPFPVDQRGRDVCSRPVLRFEVQLQVEERADRLGFVFGRIRVVGAPEDPPDDVRIDGVVTGRMVQEEMGEFMALHQGLVRQAGALWVVDAILAQILFVLTRGFAGTDLAFDEVQRAPRSLLVGGAEFLKGGVSG
ncbi:hypothetical protein SAZ_01540 [Streptomyces noursei ZPM]|nr:hypothetical protein SAZ_01540 [Streptomyces noursei ZPM]EOT01415.1 hypothetical protein K530_23888 [Streptomyces noursei CCRC 11814]EXU92339.1 hypothetical protein P354_26060 [Streptomyces noursei PD-1]